LYLDIKDEIAARELISFLIPECQHLSIHSMLQFGRHILEPESQLSGIVSMDVEMGTGHDLAPMQQN